MSRPHRLWHGAVPADAILFHEDAARRIAASWRRGATLHPLDDGWLLVLPANVWMRAHEAPGEVFRRVSGRLSSVATVDAARYPPSSILRLRGGAVVAVPVPAQPVAADTVIDVSAFALVDTRPLAGPASAQAPARAEERASSSEILNVERSPEADRVVADLVRRPIGSESREGGVFGRLGSGVATLLRDLVGVFRGNGETGHGEPRVSKPWRILETFRSLFNRFLIRSRLASLFGQKQAEYMASLVDMLQRRKLEDALRIAIPLTDDVVNSLGRLTFGTPRPRNDLSLNLYGHAHASTVMAGGNFHAQLRALYQAAAEQLEHEGKIERAAFVLADLLNMPANAVSLLERHGMFVLAARLAEARKLDPALVVRQWMIAGDRDRAVAIARRYEAYEAAIKRLTGSDNALADTLRVEWATALAKRGAYALASDVLWPVEEHRDRARHWLDEAMRRGGVGGARALARKTVAAPDQAEETLRAIAALLSSEDPDTVHERTELTRTLASMPPSPVVSSAQRFGVRALLRDVVTFGAAVPRREIENMTRFAGDGALRADLPSFQSHDGIPWLASSRTIEYEVRAAETGASPVFDAAMLSNGKLAVAHGEAGISILRRDGSIAGHLGEPAHHFVLSDEGDRALALARRGDSYRIATVDFLARTTKYWLDARIDAFADSYDGSTWMVHTDGAVHAIDTHSPGLESLWYTGDIGRITGRVARSAKSLAFLTETNEAWQYDLPSLTMRARVPTGNVKAYRAALLSGGYVEAAMEEGLLKRTTLRAVTDPASRVLGVFDGLPIHVAVGEEWIALVLENDRGIEARFLEAASGRERIRLHMPGAIPAIRFARGHITLFDPLGRFVVIDLERGTVRD
jgi:hypothetical protein